MLATPKPEKQQSLTPYHAKYYAHELSLEHSAGLERLTQALHDAKVDLNPHQVEAALFALRSPLSKEVCFADEVGLGKTIEAGLVLCQYWAERRRRLIVVCPASLRTQWSQELTEKVLHRCAHPRCQGFRDFDRQGIDPLPGGGSDHNLLIPIRRTHEGSHQDRTLEPGYHR